MQAQHSYIYGVRVPGGSLVPRIAVRAFRGFLFIDPSEVGASTEYDGPHLLGPDVTWQVIAEGESIDEQRIECLWSDRQESLQVKSGNSHQMGLRGSSVDHLDDVSAWLQLNEFWPRSSILITNEPDGSFSEATVAVRATNRYQLMTLLRWLDMPRELIARVTGIERL